MMLRNLKHIDVYFNPLTPEEGNPGSESSEGVVGGSVKVLKMSCERLLWRLRSVDFKVCGPSHLFCILTPTLPHGKVVQGPEAALPHMEQIAVGVDPAVFEAMNSREQEVFTYEIVSKALAIAYPRSDRDALQLAKQELLELGRELPIEFLTKSYVRSGLDIRITLKIGYSYHQYVSTLTVENAMTGKRANYPLWKISKPVELYFLAGSVRLEKDVLEIRPRVSSSAEMYARWFQSPLSVTLDEEVLAKA